VDKFEQAMQQMTQMTKEDRMKMIESRRSFVFVAAVPRIMTAQGKTKNCYTVLWAKAQGVSLRKTVAFVQAVRLPSRWGLRISISVQEALKKNKEECKPCTLSFFSQFSGGSFHGV